jgi:hypothetical protein
MMNLTTTFSRRLGGPLLFARVVGALLTFDLCLAAGAESTRPTSSATDKPSAVASSGLIWSLQPIRKPIPPQTKLKGWTKTPIDQFILAKLEAQGMKPSDPADKRTLLRRVTLDLTGLQPTTEELQSFLRDRSPNAFEKVLDRLLDSPRYGERWARHWLDLVHYADTHGHSQDRMRTNAWPYRDYIIRAFNTDKPYERFVKEQLAGDVFYPDEPDGIVALGFIAAGPWDDSSQVYITENSFDKRTAQNLDRDDMVSTAISTFTSTTVHCARCHNHKFDPIPQKEYYNLQAVFAGIDRVDRPYDLDPQTNAIRQLLLKTKSRISSDEGKKTLLAPEVQAEVDAWEKQAAYNTINWTVLDPASFKSEAGATLTKQADLSLLAGGTRAETDTYTITATTELKGITAIRLEVLIDDSLPLHGPGRADNGNLALSEIELAAAPKTSPDLATPVGLQNASADFNELFAGVDYDAAKAIDGDLKTSWGIYPEVGRAHFAVFELKETAGFDGGTVLTFVLKQKYKQHLIGRPRLSVATAPRPVRASPFPEAISKILAVKSSARTPEQKTELAVYVLKERVDRKMATLPTPHVVYAVANDFTPRLIFKPPITPRPIHVLKRGDIDRPGDEAVPGALSMVPGLAAQFDLADPTDEGSRRASLAKWIVDPKNVLTWRSIVNRAWQYHFGRAIVDSPNDFGEMGAKPSHPDLLDWLASSFRENGGSFKKLHKLILSSAAYQQRSDYNAEFDAKDSQNIFLSRMNRGRLDAEELRDSVLQASGKLDLTMGGPGARQFGIEDPTPPVTPVVDYSKFDVDSPASFRRSIYRFIYRTLPDPFMDTLDCPDASLLTPVRNTSVTALQALAMWNNRFMLRQSEHLAERVAVASPKMDGQIDSLYRLVLGRSPTKVERTELKIYAAKYGMANACRVMLNCDEFLFIN